MDANRLGDTNHGFRRRSRSSGKDVEPDDAHRSKRCRPEEGQGKDRDLRGSRSDVGRRDRDVNQDVRGPDQCFKEHISIKEPTKELAYQSGKEPAPVSGHSPRINVSVSDQSDKKHMSVSHQSVRKLAHQSDGKLLSADKKALSISQHSSKPPISVAGKSSVPTECLVLENVFEKSVVLAFDESDDSVLSSEVEIFIHEKCARFGGTVIHMYVDMPHGLVYVRFANTRYAARAKESLDGTL